MMMGFPSPSPMVLVCLLVAATPFLISTSAGEGNSESAPEEPFEFDVDVEDAYLEETEEEKLMATNLLHSHKRVKRQWTDSNGTKYEGIKVPESEWHNYWPPPDPYTQDEQGLKNWEKLLQDQIDIYNKYKVELDKITKNQSVGLGRPYPFCVDGYKPHLKKFVTPDRLANFNPKDPTSCDECVDKNLIRFLPLFSQAQPSGAPLIETAQGKAPLEIVHKDADGNPEGAYIESIKYHKLIPPRPYIGMLTDDLATYSGTDDPNPDKHDHIGYRELTQWFHIVVTSREPLEGLYMQAIGYPMGLPFGIFRDNFDCQGDPDWPPMSDYFPKKNKDDLHHRHTHVIPCKYSHGNNNGDAFPTAYAFDAFRNLPDSEKDSPYTQKIIRFHFQYNSLHCNKKMRVQFLVMAVKSFENFEYETYLTRNYGLNLQLKSATTPPYIVDWEGRMNCKPEVSTETAPPVLNEDYHQMPILTTKTKFGVDSIYSPGQNRKLQLWYNPNTSLIPLPYSRDYDLCVSDNHREDKISESDGRPLLDQTGTCLPNEICLNLEFDKEVFVDAQGKKQPYAIDRSDRYFIEYHRDDWNVFKHLANCTILICKHPADTIPWLVRDSQNTRQFSEEFMEKMFIHFAKFSRSMLSTHCWAMIFAWFILLSVGVFTARYYKETGGINPETTGNSLMGLGIWIWVHIILLLLSMAFMWIGISDAMTIRRKPPACNILEIYGELGLKNYCRWRKKIIILHRRIGYVAVFCYQLSFFTAWSRPVRFLRIKKLKLTLPIRKYLMWTHAISAYAGQITCLVAVAILWMRRSYSICKDVPTMAMFIQIVTICCFVVGHIVQRMEDKTDGKKRAVFPVLEGVEVTPWSTWYWSKVHLVIVTSLIHFLLFIFTVVCCYYVYLRRGEFYNTKNSYEILRGILGQCNVTSRATQVQADMDLYFFKRF